jgi:hypothetical protein
MVYEGEQQGPEVVARKLIGTAVRKLFEARFPELDKEAPCERPRSRAPTLRSSPGSRPATP